MGNAAAVEELRFTDIDNPPDTEASFPNEVKVGPYLYKMLPAEFAPRDIDRKVAADSGYSYGYIHYPKRLIVITDNDDEISAKVTVLHEVLHAVCNLSRESCTTEEDQITEEFICQVSPMLLAVMRDNPDLATYLLN